MTITCPKCKEDAIKNPNADDYAHYDWFCPFCEIYFCVLNYPEVTE